MRHKCRPRMSVRDNSHSLSVRMTEEQYRTLRRYMALTRLPVTTYFRKLVTGSTPRTQIKDVGLDPRLGVNHIYSNVQQIIRHPYARELDAESVKSLEFLVNLLCEESFLLCNQK